MFRGLAAGWIWFSCERYVELHDYTLRIPPPAKCSGSGRQGSERARLWEMKFGAMEMQQECEVLRCTCATPFCNDFMAPRRNVLASV